MGDITTFVLYGLALSWLAFSFARDRKKAEQALRKAWKSFANILPAFLVVLLILALVVVLLPEATIAAFLGERSGFLGYLLASVVGAVTLVPGFVAFPMAKVLLDHGAGIAQMAVFISTLMMVGVVTLPLEIRYFGVKAAVWRNLLAYCYAFFVGYGVWIFVKVMR
ncbi:permease [Candidatus Caldatribacterium saccharofermentans]|uniref:Permease n=1 Tax=Candidatus Caldatribacterium saccharofermentans TaxID=1454753 RepID=A0A7V4TKF9_9BACT